MNYQTCTRTISIIWCFIMELHTSWLKIKTNSNNREECQGKSSAFMIRWHWNIFEKREKKMHKQNKTILRVINNTEMSVNKKHSYIHRTLCRWHIIEWLVWQYFTLHYKCMMEILYQVLTTLLLSACLRPAQENVCSINE